MTEVNNKYAHLRPYENSLEDRNTMYDRQKYQKDPELCSTDKVRLVSGNIYKCYSIDYKSDTPFPIDTQDELTKYKLEKMQEELLAHDQASTIEKETDNILTDADTNEEEEEMD